MVQIIPIIIAALTASAAGTAVWYVSLTPEEKKEANEK